MSTFNFQISYVKGSKNVRADALSRRPDYLENKTHESRAIFKESKTGMLEYNRNQLATMTRVEGDGYSQQIKDAYPTDATAARQEKQLEHGFTRKQDGILLFKGLVYIPSGMRKDFVKEQHELPAQGHQGIDKTLERLARTYYFPGMRKVVQDVVTNCN